MNKMSCNKNKFNKTTFSRDVIFSLTNDTQNESYHDKPFDSTIPRTTSSNTHPHSSHRKLCFMMLGCEDQPPYGPYENTAKMLLNVLCKTIETFHQTYHNDAEYKNYCNTKWNIITVSVSIYKTKENEFPKSSDEWDYYNGILLPGSYSAAYDDDKEEWIQSLTKEIQTNIVLHQRKTLGICFGHQIFAHSFRHRRSSYANLSNHTSPSKTNDNEVDLDDGGLAVPCPAGTQVGPKEFKLSKSFLQFIESSKLHLSIFGKRSLNLLYTHGDMVSSIPSSCTISLGGTDDVPIQGVVYFPDTTTTTSTTSSSRSMVKFGDNNPYCITFQAHPEYASDDTSLGGLLFQNTDTDNNDDFYRYTYGNVVHNLANVHKKLNSKDVEVIKQKTIQDWPLVKEDSLNMMILVCLMLGWV